MRATTWPAPMWEAALPVCWGAWLADDAADAAPEVAPEVVVVPETAAAGGAVGSATPEGQCQWSPWGSHVLAVATWSSSS